MCSYCHFIRLFLGALGFLCMLRRRSAPALIKLFCNLIINTFPANPALVIKKSASLYNEVHQQGNVHFTSRILGIHHR